jgi:chromosome segregation ATPase
MIDATTGPDAVRELLARFSADRDALLVALDQCRSQLTRLAGRLAMEQARVDEVEQLRAELAKAMQLAQRATSEVETVVSRLDGQPSSDSAIESVMREVVAARTSGQRFLDQTRAHLEVRIDSLAAGFEAQLGSVRDGLWDRVTELQQAVETSDRVLGGRTERLEGGMAVATDRLAGMTSELASLRQDLLREHAGQGPLGWLVHELVAWVGGLAAGGWAFGRYAAGVAADRAD